MIIVGRQIRAARSLLRITRATLSRKSGVPEVTIKAVELESGDPRSSTLDALARALHQSGVEFIDPSDGKGPGIRLQKPLKPKRRSY